MAIFIGKIYTPNLTLEKSWDSCCDDAGRDLTRHPAYQDNNIEPGDEILRPGVMYSRADDKHVRDKEYFWELTWLVFSEDEENVILSANANTGLFTIAKTTGDHLGRQQNGE